ncbi:MAG TPA: sulfatase [Opitutaceae bacterium]|nr:sulfatase [Opitutaceae bacterium]
MRRIFCFALFLVLIPLGHAAARQPNIVMILADDLGWADLGQDGSKIDTPNLDRLAKQGVKLTRFYASAPMCSPTRAALLTGRYPHSVGMPELSSPKPRAPIPSLALDHAAVTIPEALKPAGYRSVMVGKWHLGASPQDWPRTHGFDEFWGSLIGTPMYWQVKETYHNETPIKVQDYYTDALTDVAIDYLKKFNDPSRPLFLYLAYNAPHYPLEAPATLVYKYRRRFPNDGLFAVYAAMVERLDTDIGRVLAALDELKMADNTIVVFSSDNGPSAEPNSYGPAGANISNGPLREYKFSTHEGGIRVPFIARWPGQFPAGAVRKEPAVTMDLMPTFLEAAGVRDTEKIEMHGHSLLAFLRGGPFVRKEALHWENRENAATLLGDWKLVQRFWTPQPQLYRIEEDIGENHDLAAQNPDKVRELMALHAEWKARYYPNPIPRELTLSRYMFPEEPASEAEPSAK